MPMSDRRQRIHELVLTLLARQGDLDLLVGDGTGLPGSDAGNWIERNRRVVQRYQAWSAPPSPSMPWWTRK